MKLSPFDLRKHHTLQKNDKSRKGSVDEGIRHLIEEMNLQNDIYTTSSCSGRISLFGEATEFSKLNGKKGVTWVYSSHTAPSSEDIPQAVNAFLKPPANKESLVFRFEPFIVACECRTLEVAKTLVQIGIEAGFRESGIVIGHDKFTVTIRSSAKMEIPVCHNGTLLLSTAYLDLLTRIADDKFKKNNSKINQFYKAFRKIFPQQLDSASPSETAQELKISPSAELHSISLEWSKISPSGQGNEKLLHRWGHSACAINGDQIVLFGGYGGQASHQRLNDVVCFNPFSETIQQPCLSGDIPSPRMNHTSAALGDSIYIIGGRTHPQNPLGDIFLIDTKNWTCQKLPLSFPKRFRHTSCAFGERQIVIFGGCGEDGPLNDVWLFNVETQDLEKTITSGLQPCPRMSHGACISGTSLFIHGGFADYHFTFNDIFKLDLETFTWSEIKFNSFQSPFCFSHCLVSLDHETLVIFGKCEKSKESKTVLLNTRKMKAKVLKTMIQEPHEWVGVRQQCTLLKNKLILVGGGAFCFSFGSVFSATFSMPIQNLLAAMDSPLVRKEDIELNVDIHHDILWGIVVPKVHAKQTKDLMKSLNWLNLKYKSSVFESGYKIAFPLKPEISELLQKTAKLPILDCSSIEKLKEYPELENRLNELASKTEIVMQAAEFNLAKTEASSIPPGQRLKLFLTQFLKHNGLEHNKRLLNEIPEKWERLGDVILLPEHCLQSNEWTHSYSNEFWKNVAQALGCHRLARQTSITKSEMRCSKSEMLFGSDGWVQHLENGVVFSLDITKCMFSSGNVTERIRMSELSCSGETIVDLYAGIGYFTLPILVIACEWNRHAIKALKTNLKLNCVEANCEVLEGDCRKRAPKRVADRVLLGLLPSSCGGWKTAIEALKPTGGWLHLHENVKDTEESDWVKETVHELDQISSDLGYDWEIRVQNCERVKWYAPHIRHVVLDIYCQPSTYPQQHSTSLQVSEVPIDSHLRVNDYFWSEVFPSRQPSVIKGMDLGTCTETWTAEYLAYRKESNETFVSVHVFTDLQAKMNFLDKNFAFHTMPFTELIERCAYLKDHKPCIAAHEHYYLRSIGTNPRKVRIQLSKHFVRVEILQERSWIEKSFPELSKDVIIPSFVDKEEIFSTVLRVSSPNVQLWTHFDVMDNLLIQITGTKIVTFWPPSDDHHLYVKGSSSEVVDIENPDLDIFPDFEKAKGFVKKLEPGDVLYIPALWFHNVKSESFSVSVNVFFHHPLTLPKEFYDKKDLYGNRDPLPVQTAQFHNSQTIEFLNQLPIDFRQFYGNRMIRDLQKHVFK